MSQWPRGVMPPVRWGAVVVTGGVTKVSITTTKVIDDINKKNAQGLKRGTLTFQDQIKYASIRHEGPR